MGYGQGKRMAIERDEIEILGGIRHGLSRLTGGGSDPQHRVATVV